MTNWIEREEEEAEQDEALDQWALLCNPENPCVAVGHVSSVPIGNAYARPILLMTRRRAEEILQKWIDRYEFEKPRLFRVDVPLLHIINERCKITGLSTSEAGMLSINVLREFAKIYEQENTE